jgi:hypothetical protein
LEFEVDLEKENGWNECAIATLLRLIGGAATVTTTGQKYVTETLLHNPEMTGL